MLTDSYWELLKHVSATRLAAVLQQTLETDRARLLAFCSTRRSRKEMMLMLNITSPKLFYRLYLNPLLETGELRRVIPDRPCVSTQQYIRAFKVRY